jgi:hypothetical protein
MDASQFRLEWTREQGEVICEVCEARVDEGRNSDNLSHVLAYAENHTCTPITEYDALGLVLDGEFEDHARYQHVYEVLDRLRERLANGDGLNNVKVGDPDPTAGGERGDCNETFADVNFEAFCTRGFAHTGQHVAGNGEQVIVVWPNQ